MKTRTTATKPTTPCQRCEWTYGAHQYAETARAKLSGHPTFQKPGQWPCPEFVRPSPGQGWSWRDITPTGWFVLCYVAFLLAIIAVADWIAG